MPVGIVDVGANTVRLQVSRGGVGIHRAKAMLRLGETIEQTGMLSEEKLTEVSTTVAGFVGEARGAGADRIEVLVTSPGRQAENGATLLARLTEATGLPVRVLSAEEEGRLGFLGAVSTLRNGTKRLTAVCDVGGGSAQIAVGIPREGASWVRSIDIGSMRLTARYLDDDPPGDAAVQEARLAVDAALADILPPLPEVALAVGGSARALRAIVGPRLGAEELEELAEILARTPYRDIISLYGVDAARVRTLAAGAVILGSICARLHSPLKVVRGGVREGALLELGQRREAA